MTCSYAAMIAHPDPGQMQKHRYFYTMVVGVVSHYVNVNCLSFSYLYTFISNGTVQYTLNGKRSFLRSITIYLITE